MNVRAYGLFMSFLTLALSEAAESLGAGFWFLVLEYTYIYYNMYYTAIHIYLYIYILYVYIIYILLYIYTIYPYVVAYFCMCAADLFHLPLELTNDCHFMGYDFWIVHDLSGNPWKSHGKFLLGH